MSELFPKITAPTLILKADADDALKKQNEQVAGLLKSGRSSTSRAPGTTSAARGKKKRSRS